MRSTVLPQPKFAGRLFGSILALGLLLTLPARAEGVSVTDASAAQRKQAAHELSKGQKLFKAGKFPEAIVALSKSRDIVADPAAGLLIARAYQNSGDLINALAAYSTTVREARGLTQRDEKYRATLEAAQRELKELEGVVARVTIHVRYAPPGTQVDIDGEVVPAAKLSEPVVLAPGLVRITARTPDGLETDRQVTLSAGQDAKVELAFPRDTVAPSPAEAEPPEPRDDPEPETKAATPGSGKKTAAFVAGGVGVAGLAVFGVFGALSNSKYHDLEGACVANRCPSSSQSDIDQGKRFQTLANVGLVAGIVGVGTSAALFIWASRKSEPSEGDTGVSRLELGIGPGSLQLRGSFQ